MSGTMQIPPADPSAGHDRNKLLASILQVLKALGIQLGPKSTTATAGTATLPGQPAGFVTMTFSDGSTGKVPFYNA